MTTLLLGLILFLGAHSISIFGARSRDAYVARIGLLPWMGLYSLVSVAGLVLIVNGYGAARFDPVLLYAPPVWTRHLALLLMVPVFPLLLAAYLPGRIARATRHPMLVATKLWAVAHLLANGMLADVVLFGALLAWAVADRISLKRRSPQPVPGLPAGRFNDAIAVVAGLALYTAFLAGAHRWLTGVAPIG